MSIFDSVYIRKPGRSLFNLSHERKLTADFAKLYPVLCTEVVPNDTFKISTEMLVRTAPLIAPIMHRVNVKLNYFFVPFRLLWDEWESFITGVDQQHYYDEPLEDYFVQPVPPYFQLKHSDGDDALFYDGTLADHLGFPTMRPTDSLGSPSQIDGTLNISAMPFFAYNKIYVDWFRNQNVEGGYVGAHTSGKHTNKAYLQIRKRMWEKDYFTSALPFAQRGDAMPIPIAKHGSIDFDTSGNSLLVDPLTGNTITGITGRALTPKTDGSIQINAYQSDPSVDVSIDNSTNLKISDTAIGSINDLRIATRIQRWLEKNARVGGRYIEQILAHFGVRSSDARLQRAEYLGGYTLPIVVSDVEQQSATVGTEASGTDTPQGTLAGKGSAYGKSKPIKFFAEEHGYLMCLLSIMPKSTYQDGFPRQYMRDSIYDYYFPEFAYLGEQEIKKSEVYFNAADLSEQSDDRFGFQERYCEYKYIPSTVHGEFKNSLQFWHLGRSFSSQPSLNKAFVTCNQDGSMQNRIFAISDENVTDMFYVSLYHEISALRPMPKHSIPTL